MFNADAVAIKRPLHSMSHLKFVGSRLITGARYLSGWTFPALKELYRIPGRPFPITIQPGGQLLLTRQRHEYRIVDTVSGGTVNVCPAAHEPTGYPDSYALSACGGFIVNGERGAIRVREIGTGATVWERTLDRTELHGIWPLYDGTQWAFCVSPVPAVDQPRRPTTLEIWDWPLGALPRSVLQRDYVPYGSSVSNEGLMAFPGFGTTPARLFDIESGRAVREFAPAAGNRSSGRVHWVSGDRLLVAWERSLCVCALDGTVHRTFHLPTYSSYSAAATDDLLALVFHDGFVVVPLDRIPGSQTEIELSPPWSEPPGPSETSMDHGFVTPIPGSRRTVFAATADKLRAALQEFERPAWVPQVRFRSGEITSSKLGGTPFIPQTQEWPHCGVCSRPMELLLQLNSKDLPVELAHRFSGLLQVFLCVTNGYSTGTCVLGSEGFSKGSVLRLLEPVGQPRYRRPPFEDAFIEGVIESWQRRADFPVPQDLQALGIKLSRKQSELMTDHPEQFAAPGDKLGGWADWPQNLEYIACPRCKRRMDVIFQFGSGDTLPHCFMDGGTAWVSQCAEHPDVLALTWNS